MMTMSWIVTGTEVLADAVPAAASVAPPASAAATAAAAIRDLALIRGIFMIALLPWGRHAGSAAVRGGGPRRGRFVAVSVAGMLRAPGPRLTAGDSRRVRGLP